MIDNSAIVLRGQEPNLIMIADYVGNEYCDELNAIIDILHEVTDIDGDIRYYLCDLTTCTNARNDFNINDEESCLHRTAILIEALKQDYIQHCATRRCVDRLELSVSARSCSRTKSKSRIRMRSHDVGAGALSPIPNIRSPLTPFQRIDRALAQYYYHFKPQNYGGKFMFYVQKHGFDENEIEDELGDGVIATDSMYIEMDPHFPLYSSMKANIESKEDKYRAIFNVIQYCYKYGEAPTEQQYRIHASKCGK
eukprot:TRINITY_DN11305_c0_g1_i1.p1 TRINITY_DN11305_c0_g1~~TRINITY_DN11305_c0_g1_i1.p1  ORF type:complete len:252 (+),score=89.21 TRINITY_DN11305_c0_g1_i1:92-847(+)